MNFTRQLSVALIFGASAGLVGCRSPLGGLAFWNKGESSSIASTAPNVGEQKYAGLSKEFAGTRPMGQPAAGTAPLGGQKPASNDNFITSSWKSTTGAIAGAFSSSDKQSGDQRLDASRLDTPSKKPDAVFYVEVARRLENLGNAVEAQQQYEKALSIAPKDFNALIGLARLQDRDGRTAEAQAVYQRAIKAHPKNALVYNDLGLSYARQRQLDKSLASLSKAVELAPDSTKYRNNLATVLVESGRTDEALAQLSTIGSPAVAHYNVGYLLLKKDEKAAAAQHFQQALSLDPGMAPAREMLAKATGQPLAEVASAAASPTYGAPAQDRAYETAGPYAMQQPSGGGTSATFASTPTTVVAPYQSNYSISDEETSPGGGYYDQPAEDTGASRLPPAE